MKINTEGSTRRENDLRPSGAPLHAVPKCQNMYTHKHTHPRAHTHTYTQPHILSKPLSRVSSASRLLVLLALTLSGLFDYCFMCVGIYVYVIAGSGACVCDMPWWCLVLLVVPDRRR